MKKKSSFRLNLCANKCGRRTVNRVCESCRLWLEHVRTSKEKAA